MIDLVSHSEVDAGWYGKDPSLTHKVISRRFVRLVISEVDQLTSFAQRFTDPPFTGSAGSLHEAASGRALRLHAGRGAEGLAHRDQPVAAHPCAACGRHGVARSAGG